MPTFKKLSKPVKETKKRPTKTTTLSRTKTAATAKHSKTKAKNPSRTQVKTTTKKKAKPAAKNLSKTSSRPIKAKTISTKTAGRAGTLSTHKKVVIKRKQATNKRLSASQVPASQPATHHIENQSQKAEKS